MRKTLLLLLLVLSLPVRSYGQGSFSTKAQQELAKALTSGGIFGVPRYTTVLLPTCNTANRGAVAYDTTAAALTICSGSAWGAAGFTSPLAFASGGTGLTSAADDTTLVSSGSAWVASALPNCTDTGGNHINYTAATNAFSCGTSGAAAGASAALDNLASVSVNTALLAQTGIDLGSTTKPFHDLFLHGAGTYGTNYFQLTGTPTGARVMTLPNFSGTLATLSGTQSWTNKQSFGGQIGIAAGTGGNAGISFGADVAHLGINTTQTPDSLALAVASTSNALIIGEMADVSYDYAHAQQTNPTLFVHSAAQSTTEWVSMAHNGTNGILNVGAGNITVTPSLNAAGGITTTSIASSGTVTISGAGNQFVLGGTAIGSIQYNSVQTPDTFFIGTGSLANNILVAEVGDNAFDFAHAIATNPTLFIHSATQSTTQWAGLTHNAVDAVVSSGAGAIKLSPAASNIYVTGTAPTVSSCGGTPSAVTGTSAAGRLTTGTGASLQACTLTFATAYVTNAPSCVANIESNILTVRAVATTTTLVIDSAVAGTLESKVINYVCVGL